MNSQPVHFFDPYAGIWPHAFPEALVASALKQGGAALTYVTCDGVLADGCTVMTAHRLTFRSPQEARESVCRMCRRRRDAITGALEVPTVTLDSLVSPEVCTRLRTQAEAVARGDIVGLQVDGLAVGRIALHETIIHFKLTSLDEMGEEALADFRLKLLHVLMFLHATGRLIEEHGPARIVNYNTHISTNYVMMLKAERHGVPTFGLHAGGNMADRFATLYVFRQDMVRLYKDWMDRFDREWAQLPATARGLADATRHFLALSTGKTVWVYSAPKQQGYFDVRAHYGIGPQQKVLLATLSSYDELFSSQMMGVMDTPPLMFASQVEWMRELIAHLAARPDLFLIIRVHPRELPNLRDKVHSTHARRLAEALVDLPPNVRINWPEEGVSLYDLLPQVDVGLNGWSSTGKELALLGIPVVLFTGDILFYPASLNSLATDRADYFRRIDAALAEGWSFARSRQVLRWMAVEYTLGVIDISGGFTYKEGARSLWRRALNRLKRMLAYRLEAQRLRRPVASAALFRKVILEDAPLIDLQLQADGRLDAAAEEVLLKREMGRILSGIYGHVPDGVSRTIDALRRASGAR